MYFDDGDDETPIPLTEEETRQRLAQWPSQVRRGCDQQRHHDDDEDGDDDDGNASFVHDERRMETWDEEYKQSVDEDRIRRGGGGGRKRGAAPLPTCHYFGCEQTFRNAPVTCPHPKNVSDKFRQEFPDLAYSFCSTQCVVDFAHFEVNPDDTKAVLDVMRVRHPGISIAVGRSPAEALQKMFSNVSLTDSEKTRAVGTTERVTWIEKRDKTVVSKDED